MMAHADVRFGWAETNGIVSNATSGDEFFWILLCMSSVIQIVLHLSFILNGEDNQYSVIDSCFSSTHCEIPYICIVM